MERVTTNPIALNLLSNLILNQAVNRIEKLLQSTVVLIWTRRCWPWYHSSCHVSVGLSHSGCVRWINNATLLHLQCSTCVSSTEWHLSYAADVTQKTVFLNGYWLVNSFLRKAETLQYQAQVSYAYARKRLDKTMKKILLIAECTDFNALMIFKEFAMHWW